MKKHWLAACVCAAFVVGCDGGSGGDDSNNPNPTPQPTATPAPTPTPGQFACSPVGGGDASVTVACINCTRSYFGDELRAVIDTDVNTYAAVSLYNPNDQLGQASSIQVTGTAQSGLVFPTGSRAGLIFGLPDSLVVPFTGTLSTYLGDTELDSRSFTSDEFDGLEGDIVYLGLGVTTEAFNAVKVSLTQAGGSLEEQQFRLYEFCADGAAQE